MDWLSVGLLVALLAAVLVFRARAYGRIFSHEHFVEVARAAPALKAAAVAGTDGKAPRPPDDPRILQTSAGLVIVYTIQRRDALYVHHLSTSAKRGITAGAIGGPFLVYVAQLVGLPIEKMAFHVGKTTVHHGEVTLDENEHGAVVATSVPEVTATNVADHQRSAFEARARVDWKLTPNEGQ